MNIDNLIPLATLCTYYKVELPFFYHLNEKGVIEIHSVDKTQYIHLDTIHQVDKIIRMNRELDMNMEEIDIILNLLKKIEHLQTELIATKNRLRLYED